MTTPTPQHAHRPSYDIRVIRIAASVMAGLLMGIAVVIFWRRYLDALQTPLSTTLFFFVGLTILGPTILLRHWWRHATRSCTQKIPTVETVWTLYTPTLSLLAILVTISIPGTSLPGIVLAGILFLVGEMTVYRPRKKSSARNASPTRETMIEAMRNDIDHDLCVHQKNPESEGADIDPDTDLSREVETRPEEGVSQQLIRCRTEDGQDCLRGWLRIDIPAGLRAQNVHLAFCPPFENPPKIEVHPEGNGPKNRIKTVQCLPYGAHLEVKLSHPSPTDETLTLRFRAIGE